MSAQHNGGAAFPQTTFQHPSGEICWGESGMTLRDYFAGQALAGLLAQIPGDSRSVAVGLAYRLADEMLVERARKEAQP